MKRKSGYTRSRYWEVLIEIPSGADPDGGGLMILGIVAKTENRAKKGADELYPGCVIMNIKLCGWIDYNMEAD